MAGIGFELRKLLDKRSILSKIQAYGYTGLISSGPLLLGIGLVMGVTMTVNRYGIGRQEQNLMISMVTYTMLFSLVVSGFFSMPVTRYVADKLYEEEEGAVFLALIGSIVTQLAVGGLLFLVFLLFAGQTLAHSVQMLVLFCVLITSWNQMNFLTALKNYKGLILNFCAAVLVSFSLGLLLLRWKIPAVEAILCAVTGGYGVMMLLHFRQLRMSFPESTAALFDFLGSLGTHIHLSLIGLCLNIGMFGHMIVMWRFSAVSEHVRGILYCAPQYDIPALVAFLTTLVTTVNFMISVEVRFYPKYRAYFALYNEGGRLMDIEQAESDMLSVIQNEVMFTTIKQLLATLLVIAVEGFVMAALPLGFNDLMHGFFRTLAVGYGMYACGNICMMMLLYLTDYKGSLAAAVLFAVTSVVFSLISTRYSSLFYGGGFVASSAVFAFYTTLRLGFYTRRLPYYILCRQNIITDPTPGVMARLADKLNEMAGGV